MVDDGGEFEELPFLEIEPAERLFEYLVDNTLWGRQFEANLFDRRAVLTFVNEAGEYGVPETRVDIRLDQAGSVLYSVGFISPDCSRKCYFFRHGSRSDFELLDDWHDADEKAEEIFLIDYLFQCMKYGFLELAWWPQNKSKRDKQRYPYQHRAGPLRVDTNKHGWLRDWYHQLYEQEYEMFERAEQRSSELSVEPANGRWQRLRATMAVILVVLILILLTPFMLIGVVLYLPFGLFNDMLEARIPKTIAVRRYPPFPLK